MIIEIPYKLGSVHLKFEFLGSKEAWRRRTATCEQSQKDWKHAKAGSVWIWQIDFQEQLCVNHFRVIVRVMAEIQFGAYFMKKVLITTFLVFSAACAQTSVQPLSQNSFKIATTAAPACGAQGARDVAFKAAAIEVIKRGGDKFIILGDQSGSRVTGGTFNPYGGYTVYSSNNQDMIVRTLKASDPEFSNGLSARTVLGPEWQMIVSEGIGNTCT